MRELRQTGRKDQMLSADQADLRGLDVLSGIIFGVFALAFSRCCSQI
ncbi:MAG: hypothetical protein RIR25_349 [Verrucomicrobiota bacterium]